MEDKVTNPFENENGVYHVLINDEGQSLANLQTGLNETHVDIQYWLPQ
jgi:hypothetical protein